VNRDELDLLIKNGFLQANPGESLTANELSNLVNQGFLEELPNHFFTFHNNLTWEVIYETLLFSERRLLHNIIAIHIEKNNANNLDAVADILLHHFENAREYKKCVFYGAKAGDRESTLFSNEEALSFYNRALNALDNINHALLADRSLLYEHIGDVYENSGNHKEALANYQFALDTWQKIHGEKSKKPALVPWKIKPSTNEAYLMRKLAMSYEHNSEFDSAITWLDQAERILPTRPGRVAAQIAATRSATLYKKGDFLKAMEYGQRALQLARRSGRKEDEAYAHNMIANSCNETGDFKKAIRHLQKSSDISQELNDFPGIAISNYNLGNSYWALGALQQAANHYKMSLEADETMHNVSGMTMDHYSLGSVLLDIGELDQCIEYLSNVVTDYDSGNARRDLTGMTLAILGKAYRLQGKIAEAEKCITRSLDLLKGDSESGIFLHVQLQLAELLISENKPGEAKQKCLDLMKQVKETKAISIEIILQRTLGNAYFKLHDLDQAFQHLNDSIKIASEIGAEHEEALSIIDLAEVCIKSDKVSKDIRTMLVRAVDTLDKIGAKLDLKRAKNLAKQLPNS